jgi:hypothetical protein
VRLAKYLHLLVLIELLLFLLKVFESLGFLLPRQVGLDFLLIPYFVVNGQVEPVTA